MFGDSKTVRFSIMLLWNNYILIKTFIRIYIKLYVTPISVRAVIAALRTDGHKRAE